MKFLISLCVALLVWSWSASTATAHAAKKNAKPVRLTVEVPFGAGRHSIQNSSGWPLTIRLLSRNELGIANSEPGFDAPIGTFPRIGQTGWIVFDDPDGCLTLLPPFSPSPTPDDTCLGAVTDETFLGFTPDLDQPGLEDSVGDADRRAALTEAGGGGMATFTAPGVGIAALGPDTGGDVIDGYGRGADDDLPGLVVLSATGPGLVLDPDFDRGPVLEQHNLAGFLNQVGYELNDRSGHTTVFGNMLVPYGLFAPFVQADTCVSASDPAAPDCDGDPIWRIDGGPVEPVDPPENPLQLGYENLFNSRPYELRFFVVNGIAPSMLSDMNGDGRITEKDARLMGYEIISNAVRIEFDQFHGPNCFRPVFSQVLLSDLDGNGSIEASGVCPGGPGGLTKPPR